jgi:hypothetical protein
MGSFYGFDHALNAMLLVGTAVVGIWLWAQRAVGAGIVATARPTWRRTRLSGIVPSSREGGIMPRFALLAVLALASFTAAAQSTKIHWCSPGSITSS